MTAILSDDLKYRYRLEREVQPEGFVIAYFGINPSTADATIDDSTVKKWIGFSKRFGARKFIVGNVFAYRATDVKELASAENPIGPENPDHVWSIIHDADLVVPCWGNKTKVPKTLHQDIFLMSELIRHCSKRTMVFGLTKAGDPLHPLMLPYSTELALW